MAASLAWRTVRLCVTVFLTAAHIPSGLGSVLPGIERTRPPAPPGRMLQVAPASPLSSLTSALAEARDGDTIVVHPGRYAEGTLVIEKSIRLIGLDYPILDGLGQGTVLSVRADGVLVQGFRIRNTGASHLDEYAGIRLESVQNCRVEDNRLSRTFFGIYLADSRSCSVRANQIRGEARRSGLSGNGIHLWKTSQIQVTGNSVQGHRDGIYLEFSEDALISGNRSADSLRYGLHFMFSDRCRYLRNHFLRNGAGVAVMYSRGVAMVANRFEANQGPSSYGLLLKEIDDGEIRANRFIMNTVGLQADDAQRLTLTGNLFRENGWAVRLFSNSGSNRFEDNTFIENTFEVASDGGRSDSNVFRRNYWSQYEGYDLDRDGLGDIPHHPVRLFSLITQKQPLALFLLRSFLAELLDFSERVMPVLTPATLADGEPRMRPGHD